MSTRSQPVNDPDETDEAMPPLESVSDSSESEEDQIPQRSPTTTQDRIPSHPIDPDPPYTYEIILRITESGTLFGLSIPGAAAGD